MIKSFEEYKRVKEQMVNGQNAYIWHYRDQALLIRDVKLTRQDIINEFYADLECTTSQRGLSFASNLFRPPVRR